MPLFSLLIHLMYLNGLVQTPLTSVRVTYYEYFEIVLAVARIALTFFVAAQRCFEFVAETVLVTQQYSGSC